MYLLRYFPSPLPLPFPALSYHANFMSQKGGDRSSSMLIHQLNLPYFPDTPHVHQESTSNSTSNSTYNSTPTSPSSLQSNGHTHASRTRLRDRIHAAAHAEVPATHGLALDGRNNLNLIPYFLQMISPPKDVS